MTNVVLFRKEHTTDTIEGSRVKICLDKLLKRTEEASSLLFEKKLPLDGRVLVTSFSKTMLSFMSLNGLFKHSVELKTIYHDPKLKAVDKLKVIGFRLMNEAIQRSADTPETLELLKGYYYDLKELFDDESSSVVDSNRI